jgi:hypothetical protein
MTPAVADGSPQAVLTATSFWVWVIAGFIVFAYAWLHFNNPPTNRSSTTFFRFHSGALLYASASLAVWGLISAVPPDLIEKLPYVGIKLPEEAKRVAWPLGVALIFAGLAPEVPYFKTLDAKIRRVFDHIARVLEEAEALAARLRTTPLLRTRAILGDVEAHLKADRFVDGDIAFGETCDIRSQWTRLTALLIGLEPWTRQNSGLRAYLSANAKEFQNLKDAHAALTRVARVRFEVLRQVEEKQSTVSARLRALVHRSDKEVQDLDAAMREAFETLRAQLAELERELTDDLEQFDESISRFVARAVLHAGKTRQRRQALLEELGFAQIRFPRWTLFDRLSGLFLGFLIYYVFVLALWGPADSPGGHRVLTGVGVAFAYAGAVVVAVYLKRWEFFRLHATVGSILAAVISMAVWLVIFTGVWGVIARGDVSEIGRRLGERWNWVLVIGATAFTTASLTGGPRPAALRRAFQSGLQGLVTALFVLAGFVLAETFDVPRQQLSHILEAVIARYAFWPSILSAVITGAVIGGLVPFWYSQREVERENLPEAKCWSG